MVESYDWENILQLDNKNLYEKINFMYVNNDNVIDIINSFAHYVYNARISTNVKKDILDLITTVYVKISTRSSVIINLFLILYKSKQLLL